MLDITSGTYTTEDWDHNIYCGCPNGGEQVKISEYNVDCCMDGKSLNTETLEYTDYSPYCGCPNGGEQIGFGRCCKNNKGLDNDTGEYTVIDDFCVTACPEGQKLVNGKKGGKLCCYDGYIMLTVVWTVRA